jgi:predicted DNA binding CopG/RHH family protein
MKKNRGEIKSEIVDEIDLSEGDFNFKRVEFSNIKNTDWDQFYSEKQKENMPVSLRLPKYFVTKIKQRAIELGMPYQSLIRLWIAENIGLR